MDDRQLIYCNEVMKFRKVLNLTSISDVNLFYKTFINPSLQLGKWIDKGSILLDIGSGMGVPGLPLLINRPDIKGVLVERRKKRTEFIRHVVRKLKLQATVYDADIYDLEPINATVCVARAVSSISTLLDMCDKHIIHGGKAVLPVPDEAVIPNIPGWVLVDEFNQTGFQRIVVYKKRIDVGGVSRET